MADDPRPRATDRGPQPESTPGLEPGGGVAPGDTPPGEDSLGQTVERRDDTPNMGPVAGNRTPMIITLVAIGLLVLAVLGYGVAQIIGYASD
jgi:hypothetical protein